MRTPRVSRMLATLVMLATWLVIPQASTAATTITVNTTHDDVTINGNCTLREAVIAANTDAPVDGCTAGSGADTILLPAGTYPLAQVGTCEDAARSGDLDIAGTVILLGAGASATVINGGSLSYPNSDRVIHVLGGGDLALAGVTVRGGVAGAGGGILNQGKLLVEDSRVTDNVVSYNGQDSCSGGLPLGGAGIYNSGELTLRRTELSGNQVWGTNRYDVDSGGGGLSSNGIAVVESSTFSGNWAAGGSGIYNSGDLTVSESLFDGNGARFYGAGLENTGVARLLRTTISNNVDSGIYNAGTGVLTLTNSTVNGNLGYRIAGGITNEGTLEATNCTISGNDGPTGGIAAGGVTTLTHCTITSNSGWSYGGIGTYGEARLQATIVAHNSGTPADCSGPVSSLGYNLDGDGSCNLSGPGDLSNTNAVLGYLADNGGLTKTHALLAQSPAIDAVPAGECALTTDQRGVNRPLGTGCDSGAYEANPDALPGALTIDIRPKIAVNVIDVQKMGVVPVAVLSSANFDAPAAVDWGSLRFGRTGDEDSLRRGGTSNRPSCSQADVSGDGQRDLVCNFAVTATGFQCGDTVGVLKARLAGIGTTPMTAQDSVVIVPCR